MSTERHSKSKMENTMETDLIKAWQSAAGRTENGGLTNITSESAVMDLFFQIGAFRNRSEDDIVEAFRKAYLDSPLDAMRVLFYSRDIRGGQGERKIFRTVIRRLAVVMPEVVQKNIALIPEYGRWDDILNLMDTPVEVDAINLIKIALLENEDSLCAKWMPREKSSNRAVARKLASVMNLSSKAYRKLLSRLTKVVETSMCSNEWGSINFEHVPSYAMKNYRKAFASHDAERWDGYISAVERGEAKVNASTLFPHDLIRQARNEQSKLIEQQWKALPNYMEGNKEIVLPMCDVSGSMTMDGGLPMEVSIALGLYISERNEGIFKDVVLTFTDQPELYVLTGKTLSQRQATLRKRVGYNTDIDKAFYTLLDKATSHSVPSDKMPTTILILSDMEFDNSSIRGTSMTAFKAARQRYQDAGYDLPKIVFWNLSSRSANGNFPVKNHQTGSALVSGFSPSILTQLLSGSDSFTPESIMRKVIDGERYSAVTV
jgi:hypothetical protein